MTIEQKAREIAERMAPAGDVWDADVERISLGIIEGRRQAFEEAAKVADDHAFNAWHIADAEGQNSACASGRNHGARAIARAIRALIEEQKV